jgi:hypothetical protein
MNFLRPLTRPSRLLAVTALLGFACISSPAAAGPITPATWWEFGFSEAGVLATGCDPADPSGPFCIPSSGTPTSFLDAPSWTITVPTGGAFLTVTDAFASGDRFQIFDFGIAIGLTSVPAAPNAVNCGDDPIVCLGFAGISKGVFALAAGNHSLTLAPTLSPGDGGSGYLRVDVVPEPATMLLVATGLCLTGLRRARARR